MSIIDFHSALNRLSINSLRRKGIKLPPPSEGAHLTKKDLRIQARKQRFEQRRTKLNYDDLKSNV